MVELRFLVLVVVLSFLVMLLFLDHLLRQHGLPCFQAVRPLHNLLEVVHLLEWCFQFILPETPTVVKRL